MYLNQIICNWQVENIYQPEVQAMMRADCIAILQEARLDDEAIVAAHMVTFVTRTNPCTDWPYAAAVTAYIVAALDFMLFLWSFWKF